MCWLFSMMIFVAVVVVVYLEISMFVVDWETLMLFDNREATTNCRCIYVGRAAAYQGSTPVPVLYVIPDQNDCIEAFGGNKTWKSVQPIGETSNSIILHETIKNRLL
jgi:hypothetical protein